MDKFFQIYCVFTTLVMLLDYVMARIPNEKQPKWLKNADGVLHFLEIQFRQVVGMPSITSDYTPRQSD